MRNAEWNKATCSSSSGLYQNKLPFPYLFEQSTLYASGKIFLKMELRNQNLTLSRQAAISKHNSWNPCMKQKKYNSFLLSHCKLLHRIRVCYDLPLRVHISVQKQGVFILFTSSSAPKLVLDNMIIESCFHIAQSRCQEPHHSSPPCLSFFFYIMYQSMGSWKESDMKIRHGLATEQQHHC